LAANLTIFCRRENSAFYFHLRVCLLITICCPVNFKNGTCCSTNVIRNFVDRKFWLGTGSLPY
jgi:hypothetical protein